MRLEQGATYAAELSLPRIPFVNVKDRAKNKFEDLGFKDVKVWDAADGKTYGQAVWTGGTQDVDLPSQIVRAWRVA